MNTKYTSKVGEMIEQVMAAKSVKDLEPPENSEEIFCNIVEELDEACRNSLRELQSFLGENEEKQEESEFCKSAVVLNKISSALAACSSAKSMNGAEQDGDIEMMLLLNILGTDSGSKLLARVSACGFMYGIHFAKTEMK